MSNQKLGFDRLKGRENYSEWKVGARAFLTTKELWACVTTDLSPSASATDKSKDQRALAEITSLLEPNLFSYIEEITEAKKAWDALESIFEDNGVLRKVFVLEQFVMLKLSDCESITDYVNKKIGLYAKVKKGFKLDDEVSGEILLCGLGEAYRPLVMSVRDKLSPDSVKTLLLQSVDFESASENALNAQNKKKFNNKGKSKKPVKCYDCGGPHFRNKCTSKNREKSEKGECVLYSALVDKDSMEDKCVKTDSCDVLRSIGNCEPGNNDVVLYSALATKTQNDDEWFADSGASKHMTHVDFQLENIKRPSISEVKVANNERLKINHVGDLKCMIGDRSERDITLKDVHYIPKLCVNLLSVSQMVKNKCTVIFDINGVRICKNSNGATEVIASGVLENDMFKLNIKPSEIACAANVSEYRDPILWHRRLAHMNFATMGSLLNIKVKPDMQCVVCSMGKQARKSFVDKGTRASGILDLIHSDVCGPMPVQSHGHARYYNGIKHEKTSPYSPQQNGLAERMNRTIMDKVRCMLIDSGLSKQFWAEAVFAAVSIINVIPNASSGAVPDEIWNWVERIAVEDEGVEFFPIEEENENIDSGENDEIESTLTQNTPPAVISTNASESAENNEATTSQNDSVIMINDSPNQSLNETTVDDGEKDSSLGDPTYQTRARIDGTSNVMQTRSKSRDAEVLNMNVAIAYVVGEPNGYKEALRDENLKHMNCMDTATWTMRAASQPEDLLPATVLSSEMEQ
ncbi:uncharacterized protein LOC129571695 [Sitodiplosis mosellana]|uniref:uncharacterized protein LOC129571695 n=1 Tax=Sitodiplosis mosellana TaxID=263140 RepID=UPI0024442847|nr:uncharacterized protein LOC129571695 [Sitodiplosis mosellana]